MRSTKDRNGRSSEQRVRCIDPTMDAECLPSSSRLSSSPSPTGIAASRRRAGEPRELRSVAQRQRRDRSQPPAPWSLRRGVTRQRGSTSSSCDRFHEASTRKFVLFSHCSLPVVLPIHTDRESMPAYRRGVRRTFKYSTTAQTSSFESLPWNAGMSSTCVRSWMA